MSLNSDDKFRLAFSFVPRSNQSPTRGAARADRERWHRLSPRRRSPRRHRRRGRGPAGILSPPLGARAPSNFGPLPSRALVPRKCCTVRSAFLQDNEEKVVVEESFESKSIFEKERSRSSDGASEGSSTSDLERWIIKLEQSVNIFLTDSVIKILDTLYSERHYARFFVLETIARVPYFAFMSILHMYESFGCWRRADYLKVHFAESWNEMHHLLIMESSCMLLSPRMAYHFSECVESHAFSTYDKFLKAQGEELKKLPAPEVAVKYYTGDDLYLFDEFQTSRPPESRRPKIENLYDVFLNIRDDEAEHCKTMKACQMYGTLRSPHSNPEYAFEDDLGCILPEADCEGIVDCIKKSVTSSQN
ncbi:hypothetical protein EUGRSUZ_E03967 [Eucalyptus grandis]|uniref:Uncharacterized protein n=2 Tax=Eucalyptus grandis TaxID=71139 RepID=A0ACC3L0Y6_EUCGR|nr:hypothetical protein EUGRSUZ_E03967 [Eucalyptus grandis]